MVLKGSCAGTIIDWLFYLETDEHQNIFYDGYKNSNITLQNGSWIIMDSEIDGDNFAVSLDAGVHGSISPVGRRNWSTKDPTCGSDIRSRSMSLSSCIFGEEFTCDSGECIDVYSRCDNNRDCTDGTDEKDCRLIQSTSEYDKSSSPELTEEQNKRNPIFTGINLINIDFINTVSMSVGLTLEIQMASDSQVC